MAVDRLFSIQDLKQRQVEASTDAARLAALRDLVDRSSELNREEVEAYAREAVALARKAGSCRDLVRAAIALSSICRDASDADLWKECVDIAGEAARASGNPAHEGQYRYLVGRSHEVQGDYELARDSYERCLKAFRSTEFPGCVGAALNQLANLASIRGQPAEALGYYQECLKIDDELGDIANGALHQFNVGEALHRLGRMDDALESYFRVLALSEQHPEVRHMRPVALNALGELFLERDKTAQAVGIFRMVIEAVERSEVPPHILTQTTASLGLAYHRQGNHASAHHAYSGSLALAEESGDRLMAAVVLSRMAELALDMGQLDTCRELAGRSTALARQVGLPSEEAQALRVMGMLHVDRGEDTQARDCFEQAMALLHDLEESSDLARVRFHYGRYLLTKGECDTAVAHLKAASRAFRNLGIVAEGHEVNRLLFEQELQVDSDAALLQGISGLAASGVEPKVLLGRAVGLLLQALRFDSAAVVARGRPLLTLGSPNLAQALAVAAGQQIVATDLVLSWPVRYGGSVLGRIHLERAVPVATEHSHLVLDAVANLLALPIQRLVDLAVGVIEGRPELAGLRYQGVVSRNPRMLEVLATACAVADKCVPVLIRGESGTGKETIARALHDSGVRAGRPFVAMSCAALPEKLLEVECFGTDGEAAIGVAAHKGKLETSDGGTVFLEEIGCMSPTLQAKLLRVLQEKTFERVGGRVSVKVDVRIVVTTSQPLADLVAQQKLREELYHELSAVELLLPSLRERPEDIPDLVRHFVRRSSQEFGRNVAGVCPEVMSRLATFSWPGNVSELEYLVERSVLLARGDTIQIGDLPPNLQLQ
ncbi:tetratricopeptide repeat protein [candidate division WOR-3 bacterium]|uniref:Tetratricopeptide repeat protein n=1 Tax=candidate division WOR-3 bacterium TaxID=2052148 RepID=A0A937XI78_UNCW3|nr:tetratricopeptide repeat protein [candidate division WOR-3 bacterium]